MLHERMKLARSSAGGGQKTSNISATPSHGSSTSMDTVTGTAGQQSTKDAVLEGRADDRKPWATLGCCFVLLLIVVSVGLLQARRKYSSVKSRHSQCTTAACLEEALYLKEALDKNVNPCDDFYAFVCGKWKPRIPSGRGVFRDMLENVNHGVLKAVDGGHDNLGSAVSKAERMLTKCKSGSRPPASDIGLMKTFMQERGLYWPTVKPNVGVHPLDVLLDLAINWNVGLWFSLRVRHPPNKRPMIQIDKGAVSTAWINFLDNIESSQRYQAYVYQYYRIFQETPPSAILIEDLRRDEKMILHNLSTCFLGRRELAFPLHQLKTLATPMTSSVFWLRLLNKHLAPFLTFSGADRIYVNNLKLLRVVDMMTHTFSKSRLVLNIAWTFLQMYSWLASADLTTKIAPEYHLTFQRSNQSCLSLVDRTFGLAARARFLQKLSEAERAGIDQVRSVVDQSFISHFMLSPWIDATSRTLALKKLRNMQLDLWPPDRAFNPFELDAMFENFSEPSDSLLETWMRAQKARKLLMGHPDYAAVFDFDTEAPFRYMYSINVLSVSLSAVGIPLYAHGGTAAMNFGGFGAHYATSVARSFDTQGSFYDEKGRNVMWWSQASYNKYEARTVCRSRGSNATEYNQLSHVVPGLEAAFSAYRQSRQDASKVSERHARSLEEYSEDQVFFMSFCHAFCASSPATFQRESCNVPLGNLQKFADVFLCPHNSSMNPADKCGFFGVTDAARV